LPRVVPSSIPSLEPSVALSDGPSGRFYPSSIPSSAPTDSGVPSFFPSDKPSSVPSLKPSLCPGLYLALFPVLNQVSHRLMDLVVVFTLVLFHQVLTLRVVYQVASLVTIKVLSPGPNGRFYPSSVPSSATIDSDVPSSFPRLTNQVLPLV
jgi:hypothetical protein